MVLRYAKNVHGQPNNNATYKKQRVDWVDYTRASSSNSVVQPSGSASSHFIFDMMKMDFRKPWTLTAHDFDLSIPCGAYVKKITFTVRMRVNSKNIKVKAPQALFNIYGNHAMETYRVDDTGWENNRYWYNPSKYLNTTFQDYTYVMTGDEFRKAGFPVSSLNAEGMGIDLKFYDSEWQSNKNKDCMIYVAWVACTVDYETPKLSITPDMATSENNPRYVTSGVPYEFGLTYRNDSRGACCQDKEIQVTLPPNTYVTQVLNGNYNTATNKWTVPCSAHAYEKLRLELVNYGSTEDRIRISHEDIGNYDYWTYAFPNESDVGEVSPIPEIMQKGIRSCINYVAKVNAGDGVATFNVNVDTTNNSNPALTWIVDSARTSQGVELDTDESDDTKAVFNVPANQTVDIYFQSCFIPTFSGNSWVSVALDDGEPAWRLYNCLDAPIFKVRNKSVTSEDDRTVAELVLRPDVIQFTTHRIATSTEIGATIFDCGVAEFDGTMYLSDCTLTADNWEKIDYIGCVPLEYHHYDPDSTFTNKGISNAYKNKVYKGKEGVIDEKISLKFKVRPAQVTTLQGLVELDKPTPINANWRCFEGDALNHRGWVVLSEIKAKRTNPLWYDCEAEVDYITHDIHTKFEIIKGQQINSFNFPSMLIELVTNADNLSEHLDIFDVQTDGGFIYDEDDEDGVNNLFSLDEGEKLVIKTRNPLTNVGEIKFDWYSNRINETRENRMRRIFRLKDSTGRTVFEYEYHDFNFDGDYVSCQTTSRLYDSEGGFIPYTEESVDLRTELEADPISDDGSVEVNYTVSGNDEEEEEEEVPIDDPDEFEEVAYDPAYIAPSFNPSDYNLTLVYGTSLRFAVNGNKLQVVDEGWNGREVDVSFELINGDYYFETEWVNENHDGNTEDIISYIGISYKETILSSKFEKDYGNLLVSPFPIPNKKVLFTREGTEGTIYYLYDDGLPFKYLLEPYYQYHNGTDLVTRDGISLMTMNNSYTNYYIDNGLVRFGFNKYSGSLYLAKYDPVSKKYITTHYFRMPTDVKFSLAHYSDDKITIKAGEDTLFTIWRGHPYILVSNPTDTIDIVGKFSHGFSDVFDGEAYDYPVIKDFLNQDNLLPTCIGGKSLDYDCIVLDDDVISPAIEHTISVDDPSPIYNGEEVTLSVTISPLTTDGTVHYLIDGADVATVESPFTYDYTPPDDKEHSIQAVYTGDDDDNFAVSDKLTVVAETRDVDPDSDAGQNPQTDIVQGKFHLGISAPSTMVYGDGKEVVLTLTKGGTPMPNYVIEKQYPSPVEAVASGVTDANGQTRIVNNQARNVPNTYYVGGRFFDTLDEDHDGNLICKAFKKITIKKATPVFYHNVDNGRVNVNSKVVARLVGAFGGLAGVKVTYTLNGGNKKTVKLDSNGKMSIKFTKKGTYKLKLNFAGNSKYNKASLPFTFKVV